jgi:dUTP pyrophosphatase
MTEDYIMNRLNIYKTHPAIRIPSFATSQSACFDLAFNSAGKGRYKGYNKNNSEFERNFGQGGSIHIMPGDRIMVPTGMIFDIPEGYSVRVHARSGLSLKQGLALINSEGIIDSDYIEETYVLLTNTSENGITLNNGDRIAQAEMVKKEEYVVLESTSRPYPKTTRVGGMGSTGVSDTSEIVKIKIDAPKKVTIKT